MVTWLRHASAVVTAFANRASGGRRIGSGILAGARPDRWECVWVTHHGRWEDAAQDTGRYEAPEILEMVKSSTLAVTTGRAAYARDGVTFDAVEYSWPVLSALLWALADAGGPIDVLDFGGGLGTSYHQNRAFLGDSIGSWRIIEQPAFVNCGNEQFRDGTLSFFGAVDDALIQWQPHVVLVSGVLQYLPDPYATLATLFEVRARTVVLDLLAVTDAAEDCLTIQQVPTDAGIRSAYPTWFFSAHRFAERLPATYQVVAPFKAYLGDRLWIDEAPRGRYVGFILRRNDAGPDRTSGS